jgi:hypothetical protein
MHPDGPDLVHCGSYLPGHDVHHFPVLRRADDPEHPPLPGRLLGVEHDGSLAVQVGNVIHHLWNHQPDRVAVLAARNDNTVSLQARWGLLRTPSDTGAYVFSVCPVDSPARTPCPDGPPPDDPIQLLRERGGFILSDEELRRRLRPRYAPSAESPMGSTNSDRQAGGSNGSA